MSDNKISDDDLNLSARREDSVLGLQSEQISVAPATGGRAVKSIFNPANQNRIVLYGASGLLLISVLFYVYSSLAEEDVIPAGGAGVVKSGKVYTSENNNPSPLQREEAERYNNEALKQVQANDKTAHPVIVTDGGESNPFEPVREIKRPERLSDAGKTEQPKSSKGGDRPQQNFREIDALVRDLIEAEGASRPRLYAVDWTYEQPSSKSVAVTAGEQPSQNYEDSASASGCKNPFVRAASMHMATTDIALNSDIGGPVSLTIRSGRLRGAQLLGTFERKEEWLRMELNKIVTENETIPIKAIGLDMETTLNAVQGEVDRHILYRYGWWGVGTILKAVGKAAEENVDSDIYISDGTVVESTAENSAREMKIALGSLGQDLGDVMRDRIDRPITVTLKVNDEVGVFFLSDACPSKTRSNG